MNTRDQFLQAEQRMLRRFDIEAESRFVDVEPVEGEARVLTCGDGPPVVMVPGFADPAALWAPLMGQLQQFRLYVVERPCFGLTGYARHDAESVRRLAVEFLDQVLDELDLRDAAFVANSIGSLWSIWLALDRPHRVASITHAGCPATLLGTSAPFPMRMLSVPVAGWLLMKLSPPSRKQVRQFAAMAHVDFSEIPEAVDLLVAMQRLPRVDRSMREVVAATVSLRGPRPEVALGAEELARVDQPVQYIWGDADPFGSPEIGRAAADLSRRAEFHVIEGAGHLPWIHDAERVARIAEPFLRTHA